MKTACRDCINYTKDIPGYRVNLSYNDLCMAVKLPVNFSYYTGEEKEQNPKYALCVDINKGDCALYKAKEEK